MRTLYESSVVYNIPISENLHESNIVSTLISFYYRELSCIKLQNKQRAKKYTEKKNNCFKLGTMTMFKCKPEKKGIFACLRKYVCVCACV